MTLVQQDTCIPVLNVLSRPGSGSFSFGLDWTFKMGYVRCVSELQLVLEWRAVKVELSKKTHQS